MTPGFDRQRPSASLAATLVALSLCAVNLFGGASRAAAAEGASRWDGDSRSAARLIAGSSPAGGAAPIRAGIEIRLKAGWHTYWRYPGDAGVPPRFDFAESQNVKAVDVLWPAPRRITEEGLIAIGYTSDVILPLVIVPQDRTKPVTLRLKLDYAVCEKLCVPAEARAELVLNDGPASSSGSSQGPLSQGTSSQGTSSQGMPSQDAALTAAEARVPKKAALGEGAALAIRSIRRDDGAPRARIIVDVATPSGTDVSLLAEGPNPEWALPVPMAIAGAPAGLQRFTFDLDGAPPGVTYQGARITLTAVAGDHAIEVVTPLD
jgi:DsbC/DsbD-like thiol-disulfide interchange protein